MESVKTEKPDNPNDSIVGLYRVGITSPDRLKKTTVGRQEMLDDLLGKLKSNAPKKSNQHFIFIGPRGIGKTHFLFLLVQSVKQSPELRGKYTIIRFPEESHRLLSFADLLLGIIEILGDVTQDENWTTLYEKLCETEDDARIVDTILPRLKRYRQTTGKTLLILLENLDTILTCQIKNEKSIHQFRGFLMDTSCATLIGTSPILFSGLYDVKQPFYDFFDIQTLAELSEEQTEEVIRVNIEYDGRSDLLETFEKLIPKIKAIHMMTGGNPRLILMLCELITKENILEVKHQFEKLLDQISPFYQDRLKDLPPQERALLETMALMRGELKTPGIIAKKLRKPPQQTSSLLKRMTEAGYLVVMENPKIKDKRSKHYKIKEGFFDLWLAMSLSRTQKKRLPFLIEFFGHWYANKQEREQKRRQLQKDLESNNSSTSLSNAFLENTQELLDYLAEAGDTDEKIETKLELAWYHFKQENPEKGKQLLHEIGHLPPDKKCFTWMVDQLDGWTKGKTGSDVQQKIEDMIKTWQYQRIGDLEKAARLAVKLGWDFSDMGLQALDIELTQETLKESLPPKEQIKLYSSMGFNQEKIGEHGEALKSLNKALNIARQCGNRQAEGGALNSIAVVYGWQGNYQAALKVFKEANKISGEIGDIKGEVNTLHNIVQAFHELGDEKNVFNYSQKGIGLSEKAGDKQKKIYFLSNIYPIYQKRGDYDAALGLIKQSFAVNREIKDRKAECALLGNMSIIYQEKKDYEKAVECLKEALKISKEIQETKPTVAILMNLAAICLILKDNRGARNYILKAEKISRKTEEPSLLCAVLFTSAAIRLANQEDKKALLTFLESYVIAKEINAVDILKNLEQITKNQGGLKFWEKLAQQMKKKK